MMPVTGQKRILIVDDNAAIHEDFCKVLGIKQRNPVLEELETAIYGMTEVNTAESETTAYMIDSAYQGEQALELVRDAVKNHQPYALAFVDIRMPPGFDGIETVQQIWQIDPNVQIVICTAYSDYSWEEITRKLKKSNHFLILKKPFDAIEIRQLATSLIEKWELKKQVEHQIDHLQICVKERTIDLEKSLSLIRATLESTPEGIIVCQHDKITMYNKVFLEIWGISEEFLTLKDSAHLFRELANQFDESVLFLRMMNELCENPKSDYIREWKCQTGKVLELYVCPQFFQEKIIATVFSFKDITHHKELEDQILQQATHDSLTGLPNRLLLHDRIGQAIHHAKRYNLQVAVFAFDLDNFKQINDSLGYTEGDHLLRTVSKKLLSCTRESDTVARLGADEFVIILAAQSQEDDIITKAKQVLKLFASPLLIAHHELTVTASMGISVYPKDGHDPDALLKNANVALYYAKEMGRNTFQFYLAEFNDQMLRQAELTTSLRQALEKNEFVLHYQPLIDLKTNKVIGLEALLRWNHATLGLLPPKMFIHLAEETGLIYSIGEWVLKTACLQNKTWHKMGFKDLCMAVNISGYQFRHKNFVDLVRKILKESDLDPHFLELEMTESVIANNVADVAKKMNELDEIGVSLSIDDFGTEYASFSYIKYFPFDKLKIAKIFIDGITEKDSDNVDTAIIEAIINMTKKMNLKVLAEGVEKPEQVDFLRAHHSDQVQGFYYSKPLDVKSCTELLTVGVSVYETK